MTNRNIKMADIVTVLNRRHGSIFSFKSFFRKAVAFFTRTRNEEPTRAVHSGLIVMMDGVPYVIEALWTVKMTPYADWEKKHNSFCIYRKNNLTFEECKSIQKIALSYLGAKYGALKIIPHFLDGIIMKIMNKEYFLFRRLIFYKDYPICSWLVAYSYHEGANENFGCNYNWASPDTILDYAKKDSSYIKTFTKISTKIL